MLDLGDEWPEFVLSAVLLILALGGLWVGVHFILKFW